MKKFWILWKKQQNRVVVVCEMKTEFAVIPVKYCGRMKGLKWQTDLCSQRVGCGVETMCARYLLKVILKAIRMTKLVQCIAIGGLILSCPKIFSSFIFYIRNFCLV